MDYLSQTLEKLIAELTKFPRIGTKTAQRLAFYLLKVLREEVVSLAETLIELKDKIRHSLL